MLILSQRHGFDYSIPVDSALYSQLIMSHALGMASVVTLVVGGDIDTITNIYYDLKHHISVVITVVRSSNE